MRAHSPGDLVADRYELEELVGTGGMSSVYRALDTLLERNVALKILHPHYGDDDEYVERFRREARAVAQLSHPNIVTVIDRGDDDGQQYIVFEYVDGDSLKQLVDRDGPLPARRAVELGLQVADALAFAHHNGLVHRDVKPQNVLVTGDGEAKVTDFGIARSLDVEHGVTQTGTVLGTSNYLSPEQARGQTVTPATDVYSLGVVLYELLTGEVPFPGENFVAVAMKHINEPPPSLLQRRPDLPMRLVAAVERALAKDPANRFPSMDAFAAELRACLAELGAPDTDATFIAPSPVVRQGSPHRVRARRRTRWPLWLALLALLVLAAVIAFVVGGRPHGSSKGTTGSNGSGGNAPVSLAGTRAFDPYGDGAEHDSEAPYATDGKLSTYWETEHYRDGLAKQGVGLVLDAGRARQLSSLTVRTDTPGYTAEILAGNSLSGTAPKIDSAKQTVNASTTFDLRGAKARYFVVWITDLGRHDSVHVNEVTARG
ncbi:MAG TPA: protein kinase [Gaiellaceae bacterium]|nr:protein kinase [Gaiellaceae bacterium]